MLSLFSVAGYIQQAHGDDPDHVPPPNAVSAVDSISPASVNNLTTGNFVATSITSPCTLVTLRPMINSMGVSVLTPTSEMVKANIRYRVAGVSAWTVGHDAVLTNTNHIDGSLFWLLPNTTYEVEVTLRVSNGAVQALEQCQATTQADMPANAIARTIYVSAAASGGGNGTESQPYATIQSAINQSQPGDQIIVQAGVYYEQLNFPNSGMAGSYITLSGQSGAILDGSTKSIEQNGLTWTPDGTYANVYSASIPSSVPLHNLLEVDPIWRDTQHFYRYDSLAGLQAGIGHAAVPMTEGFSYNATTNILTVRSLTVPNTHTWHIRSQDIGIRAFEKDYVHIEGLTIRYVPMGIYFSGSSYNIIRNVTFQTGTGILIDNYRGPVSEANRIEHTTYADAPLADWGYSAVKATPMETSAILVREGTGTIIRDNRIEQYHNGIFTGDSKEIDVYRNVIRHLSDDGIETDGNGENVRIWANAIDDINSGLSLTPTVVGPVWAIYNRFTRFFGRAFKIGEGATGIGYIYHNTIWNNISDAFGTQDVTNDTNTFVFRNNIFDVAGLAIRWTNPVPGINMDYDNVYSSATVPYFWFNNYSTLSALCAARGAECHGSSGVPQLIDPSNNLFGLRIISPNVDTALRLPGINDTFTEAGPDRGYIERGQTEIQW